MTTKQTDPQYKLRLPAELKERIERAALENKRSMNAEIVHRLEESFEKRPFEGGQIDIGFPNDEEEAKFLEFLKKVIVSFEAEKRRR